MFIRGICRPGRHCFRILKGEAAYVRAQLDKHAA